MSLSLPSPCLSTRCIPPDDMQKSSSVRLGQHLRPVPRSSRPSPFLHGPIPRHPSGHGGRQNPQAREGSRRRCHQEVGPTQVQDHPSHLVFCTSSGVDMPGADYQLTKLLGLRPSVKRLMMYQQGYFAGGTVLRLAKDLAENNAGARFLVVYFEITVVTFRGPFDTHLDSLVGQALFSDGVVAVTEGKQIRG
ncbi:hypothetical protein RJ640_013979 [Escallonia rubra]|uniref:Chalcone/stilbene synthase N-terminal domain-containing protein n=1 Tax=Escallonia rubra TaxID=112253 RepID=A0AA88RKK0_9ASTE|nr:hypothetical protein RJ640_013979 [Escallonia rubra]